MNDRTIRNIEDFAHRNGKKGEGPELGVLLEIIILFPHTRTGRPFNRARRLSAEVLSRFQVAPFVLTIEMIMRIIPSRRKRFHHPPIRCNCMRWHRGKTRR